MNKKKELQELYKARKVTGGIFRVVNKQNDRFMLQKTDDIKSAHNQMAFSRSTGSCMLPPLRLDWEKMGGDSFEIEELEQLEKKAEQTDKEFRDDLAVLYEYWDEKLPKDNRY